MNSIFSKNLNNVSCLKARKPWGTYFYYPHLTPNGVIDDANNPCGYIYYKMNIRFILSDAFRHRMWVENNDPFLELPPPLGAVQLRNETNISTLKTPPLILSSGRCR